MIALLYCCIKRVQHYDTCLDRISISYMPTRVDGRFKAIRYFEALVTVCMTTMSSEALRSL
jgi:hypothetical protein